MEEYRRKPGRDTVHRYTEGVQHRNKRGDADKRKTGAKKKGERGGTPRYIRYIRGVKRRHRIENVCARPDGVLHAKRLKLRFRLGDLDVQERRDTPAVERGEEKLHRCALVTKQ